MTLITFDTLLVIPGPHAPRILHFLCISQPNMIISVDPDSNISPPRIAINITSSGVLGKPLT